MAEGVVAQVLTPAQERKNRSIAKATTGQVTKHGIGYQMSLRSLS